MKHLLPIVLLTLGCGSAIGGENVYRFTPSPDLEGATIDALVSIEDASGITTEIAEGGVAVRWATPDDNLDEGDCADTVVSFSGDTRKTYSIVIAIKEDAEGCGEGAFYLARTVEHEMIHALRGWEYQLPEVNQGHSEHGVFQAHVVPADRLLEETSLQALCDRVECLKFNPEGSE